VCGCWCTSYTGGLAGERQRDRGQNRKKANCKEIGEERKERYMDRKQDIRR
jgi:hypothetical protein